MSARVTFCSSPPSRLPDAALWYADQGWPVFPCRPGEKVPLICGGFKKATTAPRIISAWWAGTPDANIGLAVPEGHVVIDVDRVASLQALKATGLDLPATATQSTPRGGLHLLYSSSRRLRQTTGDLAPGVDTRAAGRGYILVAPSVVDGKPYSWSTALGRENVAPLPHAIEEALAEHRPLPSAASLRGLGVAAIRQGVEEGRRNESLFKLACWHRHYDHPRSVADEDVLRTAARCRPPLPQAEALSVVDSAYSRYRPGRSRRPAREDPGRRNVGSHWESRSDRPRIAMTCNERQVVDEAAAALTRQPEVYQRAGHLVRVVRDDIRAPGIARAPRSPTIQAMSPATVRELLSEAAEWLDPQGRLKHPSSWAVRALMARGAWPEIRRLEGVVESPILRPDGTILDRPGYDPETGLIFEPSADFLPVPVHPSRREVSEALDLLAEAVCDFPFASPAHRAAWLAGPTTALARPALTGPVPLNLYDGNVPAAGKSLLADLTGMIVLGRRLPRWSPAETEAEQRKRITSIALAGDSLVLIDNVGKELGSAALDAALTATTWSDLLLGQQRRLTLPLRAVWVATGNNMILRGDTVRRCLHVRLNSPDEFPERRADFRHADLLGWARESRPRLVAAVLTLVRAFFDAGRPDQRLRAWGSYEEWSALVRNALVWAGLEDPGDTRDELQNAADPDREGAICLLAGWYEVVAAVGRPLAAREVLKVLEEQPSAFPVLRAGIEQLCQTPAGHLPSPSALGNRLKKYSERIIDGRCLIPAGRSKFGQTWKVRLTGAPGPGEPDDAGDAGDALHGQSRFSIAGPKPWPCEGSDQKRLGGASPASPASPASSRPESSQPPEEETERWSF